MIVEEYERTCPICKITFITHRKDFKVCTGCDRSTELVQYNIRRLGMSRVS